MLDPDQTQSTSKCQTTWACVKEAGIKEHGVRISVGLPFFDHPAQETETRCHAVAQRTGSPKWPCPGKSETDRWPRPAVCPDRLLLIATATFEIPQSSVARVHPWPGQVPWPWGPAWEERREAIEPGGQGLGTKKAQNRGLGTRG